MKSIAARPSRPQQRIEHLPADRRLLVPRARFEPQQQRAFVAAHLRDRSGRLHPHRDRRVGKPVHQHPQDRSRGERPSK